VATVPLGQQLFAHHAGQFTGCKYRVVLGLKVHEGIRRGHAGIVCQQCAGRMVVTGVIWFAFNRFGIFRL